MSPDEINALLTQRKAEISKFIQTHKAELFSAALKHYQTTAMPVGMFNVLEAYCIEFYGRDRAFKFAMEHIAEAALLECVATQADATRAETFAARLHEIQKSLHPKTLSEVSGLPAKTLRSYLLGQTTPPLARLTEIAIKAGYRPEWLAFGVGPRRNIAS